jgi:general secretion pathway protein H
MSVLIELSMMPAAKRPHPPALLPEGEGRYAGANRLSAICANTHSRGFTLIEMMVVMLILGLIVTLIAANSAPDPRTVLRFEAERLAQLLDLAASESRMSAIPIAWTSDGVSYRFWRWREATGWAPVVDSDTLRARALATGAAITRVHNENLRAAETLRLEFNPYVQMMPFAIEMTFADARYGIYGDAVGNVRARAGVGDGAVAAR